MESRGSCVFSSTMEEVPLGMLVRFRHDNDYNLYRFRCTKLNDDSEMFLHGIDFFATYNQSPRVSNGGSQRDDCLSYVNFIHPTSLRAL